MGFRDAASTRIGGKFLAFGDTSTGKTAFALTFPKVAAVDSETGMAHYEKRGITINNKHYNNLVMVDNTADLDELESDLDEFLSGMYDDKINTLVIDSETKFYNTMQVGAMEVEERRARKSGGDVDDSTVSQRQWGRIKLINMKLQQVKIDLSSKGIHVVSIAQATDERDKKDSTKIIGDKPDMHKTVKFDYDTVLRFFTEKNKKDGTVDFFAEVLKDRTEVTKVGDIIQNCTYDIWKNYYDGMESLPTNNTSYSKDLKTSTENMIDKADKVDDLVVEWKAMMKSLKDDPDKMSTLNKYIKENKIEIKNLALCDLSTVTKLIDFTKAL